MHILSKSTYIKGLQCEKALYLQKKHPFLRDKLSLEQRAKFQRGTDVGVLAHACFPNGVNMTPGNWSQFSNKIKETSENLANPSVDVMYEAIFQYNDTLIMLDMLVRDGDKWIAIEVKSSMSLSETYYNDAALQYYVLKGCQVPLSDFRLMYINADYVKDGDIDVKQLFKMESVIDMVKEREAFVSKNVERLLAVCALEKSPIVNIGPHCHKSYKCDFVGHCWKKVPDNSFLYTTALDDDVLFESYLNGIDSNEKMMNNIDPESPEAQQIEALEVNSFFVDYKTLFSMKPSPAPKSIAYLNMLMHRPAVPQVDGMKPYQELILAFALKGDKEENGTYLWHCFEDPSRWSEAINILIDKLKQYDMIVCFTPQNISTILLRNEILQNKEVGSKVFNLFTVLNDAHFYHAQIKYGFTLQNVVKAVFHDDTLFEHSRILAEATDPIGYEIAKDDLRSETEAVEKLYDKFFGIGDRTQIEK